jgi:ATP-dependent DNA ligase
MARRRPPALHLVPLILGLRFARRAAFDASYAPGLTGSNIVFAHACKLGLEGIVSKRVGSRYRSGASRNWLKSLNPQFART